MNHNLSPQKPRMTHIRQKSIHRLDFFKNIGIDIVNEDDSTKPKYT